MTFFENLYLGENIEPKVDQILKKLNTSKVIPDLFLITIATNPENMLDIIPEWELMQKGYPKDEIRVIGLASGKKEAIAVVQFILEETIQETGNADVRAYLMKRWEGQA